MAVFDAFQLALGDKAADATGGGASKHQPQGPPNVETPLNQNSSGLTRLDIAQHPNDPIVASGDHRPILASQSGVSDTTPIVSDPKDRSIAHLQRVVTELKTANKVKEVQLRVTKEELHNAREALDLTFAEYSCLREEVKTIKQNLGRDYQADLYRRDIELFALRKGNEQKETYIKEREVKLENMQRQQKATLEVKDAQLKLLKDRIAIMDRQVSPRIDHRSQAHEDGDHAVEVRLLRVKSGPKSLEVEDEKDAIIVRLQESLAKASKTAEDVVNQQAELQRAWDIAKKIQHALKEEREQHTQTREQLDEANVKLSECVAQRGGRTDITGRGRLPTIDEDENDRIELEAMFDTAQEDNLRLYAEVEALEKRLRDANARRFTAEHNADELREQVRLEKAINADMETARPSVVHRDYFQRMEGQVAEIRATLNAKEEDYQVLRTALAEKDDELKDLRGEVDAAVNFHTHDQDEIERLRCEVADLQATIQQLMLDHERLASQRTRQRFVSSDPENTSARFSGATLIQELSPSPGLTISADGNASEVEALPSMPRFSNEQRITDIDKSRTHQRNKSIPNRWSLKSNAVPPTETRGGKDVKHSRRKSLGFKELVKKLVRKDPDVEKVPDVKTDTDAKTYKSVEEKEQKMNEADRFRMKNALLPKDRHERHSHVASVTATNADGKPEAQDSRTLGTATMLSPQNLRPATARKSSAPRYYATSNAQNTETERPKTAGLGSAVLEEVRPVSRSSWAATNKLKRRSLY